MPKRLIDFFTDLGYSASKMPYKGMSERELLIRTSHADLNDMELKILKDFYVKQLSWDNIALRYFYSKRSLQYLHKSIIWKVIDSNNRIK